MFQRTIDVQQVHIMPHDDLGGGGLWAHILIVAVFIRIIYLIEKEMSLAVYLEC